MNSCLPPCRYCLLTQSLFLNLNLINVALPVHGILVLRATPLYALMQVRYTTSVGLIIYTAWPKVLEHDNNLHHK